MSFNTLTPAVVSSEALLEGNKPVQPASALALDCLLSDPIKRLAMSTVNFSVPDDVNEAFNATFEGHDKSAIIADLMREAVQRAQARKDFIAAVTARANLLGLSDKFGQLEAAPAQTQGDVTVIAGQAWPAKVAAQRRQLIARIQRHGFVQ